MHNSGTLTSENKAGDSPGREGDVHWVATYLIALSEKLLKNRDRTTDQDYRLASLLEDRAKLMFPAYENQRAPNFDEIIESITNCFKQQAFPWEEPLKLLNFNDTYNAQTLDPWFIPSLLVDPDDQWLNMISGTKEGKSLLQISLTGEQKAMLNIRQKNHLKL